MRQAGADVPGRRPAWMRRTGMVLVLFVAGLLQAWPASAQTSGQAHVVAVRGGDTMFRFSGIESGAGVLFSNQVGANAEIGVLGDNSDERSVIPVLSVGGTFQFADRQNTRRLVPFVAGGLTTRAFGTAWYAGGGANYWFRRSTGVVLEFRRVLPSTGEYSRQAWFVRGGVAFGFAR